MYQSVKKCTRLNLAEKDSEIPIPWGIINYPILNQLASYQLTFLRSKDLSSFMTSLTWRGFATEDPGTAKTWPWQGTHLLQETEADRFDKGKSFSQLISPFQGGCPSPFTMFRGQGESFQNKENITNRRDDVG